MPSGPQVGSGADFLSLRVGSTYRYLSTHHLSWSDPGLGFYKILSRTMSLGQVDPSQADDLGLHVFQIRQQGSQDHVSSFWILCT